MVKARFYILVVFLLLSSLGLEIRSYSKPALTPTPFIIDHKVVAVFYWATWCQPGRELLPWLDRLWKKHQAEGFELITIALDQDAEQVENYLKNQLSDLPYQLAPRSLVMNKKKIHGLPALELLSRGKVVQHTEGLLVQERLENDILMLLKSE